jgi:hypothetical protein
VLCGFRQKSKTQRIPRARAKSGKGEKQKEGKDEEKEKIKRNGYIPKKFTEKEQGKKCRVI